MRNRLSLGIAVVLVVTVATSVTQVATAWEWSRLDLAALSAHQQLRGTIRSTLGVPPSSRVALAARQDLRDEVCIAMADGRLSNDERRWIIIDAKEVLNKEEYPAFKAWLNKRSPPPASARQIVKVKRKPERKEVATTLTIKAPPLEPTIPTNVLRPERMASTGKAW